MKEELKDTGGSTMQGISDSRHTLEVAEDLPRSSESLQMAGKEGTSMPLMQPLLISKANTVLQLMLVSGYLGKALVDWPDADVLQVMALATASTTALSSLAYAHKFLVLQKN
jgi:hypothetical protein